MKTFKKPIRLVLCFTRGKSLGSWEREGILTREVLLYQKLQHEGVAISFITYGGSAELHYAPRFPGITILCNRWNLPDAQYEYWLPALHAPWLWRSHVIKSNQIWGADVAARLARLWRKPFIARCGYLWSDFMIREHRNESPVVQEALGCEQNVFRAADQIVVTTAMMADDVIRRVPAAAGKTRIIPNYVDTRLFHPAPLPEQEVDLIFVGRFVAQKNLAALLEAVAPLDIRMLLIGGGKLREPLQQRFDRLRGRVVWMGHVPNAALPSYLRRAKLFVLPSHYEGHPKALLEAMSCGLPVIGADVVGIRDVLRHGENGWLCGTDAPSLRAAIQHLLARPGLRAKLGQNARRYVQEHFSLDKIANLEMAFLREVASRAA